MYYIICEDEGSGKQFFEYIAQVYDVNNCFITSSHGNENFDNEMKSVFPMLKSGDKLLLAFDNIGVKNKFNPKQIINTAEVYCKSKNVEVWKTMYYCFEEVYLSYPEFLRMCEVASTNREKLARLLPALKYVNNAIINQEDYYDRTRADIREVINVAKYAGDNREHFCDALLFNASRELGKSFEISKSYFGDCWLKSCDSVHLSNKKYICNNKCLFKMKGLSDEEKLEDLEENSICELHRPFSDFFR